MSMLDAALELAARGFAVLPCAQRGKHPLVEHGLLDASTDPDVIRSWWSRWRGANVAVRTGDGSPHVLDIDEPEGGDTIRALVTEHGRPARGPTVHTPSDGWHVYFQAPPRAVGNRARFAPGLDWRGERGYVLVPPSIGANGSPYTWARDLAVPLPKVPGWLVDLLVPPRPSLPARRAIVSSEYSHVALELECASVAGAVVGTRNDQLNRSSFSLGTLVGAGSLKADDVTDALVSAARQAGLGEQEARRTIASGLAAGTTHPRRVTS